MNESLLAGRYAKALLAYAEEVGEAEALYGVMLRVGEAFGADRRVGVAVTNPTLPREVRRGVILGLAEPTPPESFGRFVDLVFSHNRERLFAQMVGSYVRLYRRRRGIVRACVEFSAQPEESVLVRLREVLQQKFGGEVELDVRVNRGLIGGFLLRVDGRVLDGSVRGAIERIRNQFITRNRNIV